MGRPTDASVSVEAARAILGTEGVEGLSMRVLSVESGVSLPTIYSLIGGRDDVLAAVLDQLGTMFDADVAASSQGGLDRCLEITDRLLDTMAAHATLARSIIVEGLTPMLADADSSLFRRYALALVSALADASAAGDLDEDAEPVLIVDQMVSLTAVRIFRWATADPSVDPHGEELRAAVTHGTGLLLVGSTTHRRRRSPCVLASAKPEPSYSEVPREQPIRTVAGNGWLPSSPLPSCWRVVATNPATTASTRTRPTTSVAGGGRSEAAVPCDAEPEVLTTDDGVDFVRTPDACFEDLPDWPYEPQYVEIDGLRQAVRRRGPGRRRGRAVVARPAVVVVPVPRT